MSSRGEPLKLADLGLFVLAVLTVGIIFLALQQPDPPRVTASDIASDTAPTTSPAPDESSTPAPVDQPLVVVLGDSFTNGGEDFGGQTWTELIAAERDWEVQTSAPGGSGYVQPGGGRPVPERVTSVVEDYPTADLWVVAAGASDVAREVPTDDIVARATEVLDEVGAASRSPIVLVSPFSVAAPSGATLEVGDALRSLCDATSQCTYVDATSWFDVKKQVMDETGLNPTRKGQRVLAKQFLEVLPEL